MKPDSPNRFVVFSDIHANLPALTAFLGEVDTAGFERLYCCGDVVGYGAHPNECCEIIRERAIPTVIGNHDYVTVDMADVEYFNEVARRAILWTRERLTAENLAFLESLPFTHQFGDFALVHASPRLPRAWNYVITRGEAQENFEYFEGRICFIGHSHQPFAVAKLGESLVCSTDVDEIPLKPDGRYLINVGSIGQPRDGDSRSCYVSVDLDESVLRFHRLTYAVNDAQKAILDEGLPMELAERLSYGW
jgi:diadenosine tetraphosphatase ApaH/serine/threonine PP2A family protein phosphatase